MTTPTTPPTAATLSATQTYACLPGMALHALLREADVRGASEVLVFMDGSARRGQSWVRYRVHGSFEPSEGIASNAHAMMVEVRHHPPIEMTEPGLLLIHALTYDAVPSGAFMVEVGDDEGSGGETTRWRVEFDADGGGAPHLLARREPVSREPVSRVP